MAWEYLDVCNSPSLAKQFIFRTMINRAHTLEMPVLFVHSSFGLIVQHSIDPRGSRTSRPEGTRTFRRGCAFDLASACTYLAEVLSLWGLDPPFAMKSEMVILP
jgi:hypothetical protein